MRGARGAYLVILLSAGLLITSCGNTVGTPAVTSSPEPAPVSVAPCEITAITSGVVGGLATGMALVSVDGYSCDGEWAYAFPTVRSATDPADDGYTMTMVFRSQGDTWVDQNRDQVCGSLASADESPSYPSDSLVPASLWNMACMTN